MLWVDGLLESVLCDMVEKVGSCIVMWGAFRRNKTLIWEQTFPNVSIGSSHYFEPKKRQAKIHVAVVSNEY